MHDLPAMGEVVSAKLHLFDYADADWEFARMLST